jgi:hypothetical protein
VSPKKVHTMKRFINYILITTTFFIGNIGVVLAADIDSVFNAMFRRDIGGWVAADATFSIYLPDGRTLWLFGDTFIGKAEPDGSIVPGAVMIRNSAVIQDGDSLRTLFRGTPAAPDDFIPTENPDSTWYWPEHGVVFNDTLRIFVARYRTNPEGPPGFQFEFDGNDIANLTWPGLEFINSISIPFYSVNEVIYGDRILADSIYFYIYGRKVENKDYNIPYPHVARVKSDSLLSAWEFYDGSGWTADPAASLKINSFQVSQQYGVFKHEDKYVLLTQDIWFSTKIWSFTSHTPTGPWSNKTLVYDTPKITADAFTYNAYPHPQFDNNNQLLVSYNNNGNFWDIFNNADLYRPVFIRVPYSQLDPEWITGTEDIIGLTAPDWVEFSKNYPDPFIESTTIDYRVIKKGSVRLMIYDISGRIVASYINKEQDPGEYSITINAVDFEDGIYFYQIPGTSINAKRMIKMSDY